MNKENSSLGLNTTAPDNSSSGNFKLTTLKKKNSCDQKNKIQKSVGMNQN
jgi:hypothetical protein